MDDVQGPVLVRGINDAPEHLVALARLLDEIHPHVGYLSVPTRPPAEPWVEAPPADALARAHEILSARVARVELLVEPSGTDFASLGDAARDLVSTCAVHPMEHAAVEAMLSSRREPLDLLEGLIARGALHPTTRGGCSTSRVGSVAPPQGPKICSGG